MVVKAQPSQAASLSGVGERAVSDQAYRCRARASTRSGFSPRALLASARPSFAYFGDPECPEATEAGRRGSGFVISPLGYILTEPSAITNAQANRREGPGRAASLRRDSADGDRVVEARSRSAGILATTMGLIRVDPGAHRLAPLSPVPLGGCRARQPPVSRRGGDREPARQRENTSRQGSVADSPPDRGDHRAVAATRRSTRPRWTPRSQTPAVSGGPLLDARGRRIGINCADSQHERQRERQRNRVSRSRSTPRRTSVAQLIAKGRVTYAYVGISTETWRLAVAPASSAAKDAARAP